VTATTEPAPIDAATRSSRGTSPARLGGAENVTLPRCGASSIVGRAAAVA
jgi:hypothetical protein